MSLRKITWLALIAFAFSFLPLAQAATASGARGAQQLLSQNTARPVNAKHKKHKKKHKKHHGDKKPAKGKRHHRQS